jgi:hypothetical protein
MNVTEGMRRLGLVVGVLGCSTGAVVAYTQLQSLLAQRGQYKSFQALVSSPTVKKEIDRMKGGTKDLPPPPAGYTLVTPAPQIPETLPPDFFDWEAALCGEANGWKVNKKGIGAIHFHGNGPLSRFGGIPCAKGTASEISMIETEDGQKVYRTDPPSFWAYLLLPVFPVLGFLLPWGAIKTLTWIGVGFFSQGKK